MGLLEVTGMGPIVGIGELLWDVYPDGRKVAGGAPFNFAFHCHQLGHEAVIVSRVGDDDLGKELREEVKRLGMSDEFIQTDRERPTGTVRVTVIDGQPRYDIVDNVAWDYLESTSVTESLRHAMRAVCFGSLGSRSLASRAMISRFLDSWDCGVDPDLVICDVNVRRGHFHPEVEFLNCDWLKMNEGEFLEFNPEARHYPDDYGRFIRPVWTNEVVILTLGNRGCLVDVRGEEIREPAAPANVFDTVGAGDAFTAAMVYLYLEGRPLAECARFANYYAARVCGHVGATPRIERAEVERAAFG
jgi:fructokinase